MQFRWCAGIALWTFLSGPAMNGPTPSKVASHQAGRPSMASLQQPPPNRNSDEAKTRFLLTGRSRNAP